MIKISPKQWSMMAMQQHPYETQVFETNDSMAPVGIVFHTFDEYGQSKGCYTCILSKETATKIWKYMDACDNDKEKRGRSFMYDAVKGFPSKPKDWTPYYFGPDRRGIDRREEVDVDLAGNKDSREAVRRACDREVQSASTGEKRVLLDRRKDNTDRRGPGSWSSDANGVSGRRTGGRRQGQRRTADTL